MSLTKNPLRVQINQSQDFIQVINNKNDIFFLIY